MTTTSPQPMPLAEGLVGTPGDDLVAHRADCRDPRLTFTTDWIQEGPRPGRIDIAECKGCGRRHVHRVDVELTDQVRPPFEAGED